MPSPSTIPSAVSLTTSIADARLAPPAYAAKLAKSLGISTVGDLLRHYPARYEDRTHFMPIARVRHGETVTIAGTILAVHNSQARRRMVVTKVTVRDDSGLAVLVFFNQWFLKKQFDKLVGRGIVAYGKAARRDLGRGLELTEVEWEALGEDAIESDPGIPSAPPASLSANRIVPIYPLAEGIKQERLRKSVWSAIEVFGGAVAEPIPADIRRRHSLLTAVEAARQIHFPDNGSKLDDARFRLTFEEFFGLQLALACRQSEVARERGIAFENGQDAVAEMRGVLPFALTGAQERVISEIAADMAASRPMNRLLQGDVGSGKTAVALAAVLISVRNGYQAALMAPTEILAEQHFSGLRRILKQLDIPVALTTGSSHAARDKADLQQCIADGLYPVVIGTHALIQNEVKFKNLGLAVIDEQHRFGVRQRSALRAKGPAGGHVPDVLVMTATPIPRTLTLTVYGDLDISVIDSLPPGRKPIRTHWKRSGERLLVYETIRPLLAQGRQAYVICPLIEESEKLQARAAVELAEQLSTEVFPEHCVGLLHGQMKSKEKDAAMDGFRGRELDILVSTTVIEVGVDVPNASIMIVESADRFGLAQLHQLRGRVGRGETQSYCVLVADPQTPDGVARMEVMARTCDGFEIAEEDLKLRGPGDFYGTRQSGLELLPFIDVLRDTPVLHAARKEAFDLIAADPNLSRPENHCAGALMLEKLRKLSQVAGTN